MDVLRRRGSLLVEVPAVVVIFLMMLHVTANALSRSFFGHPLPYTLEIVQYWYLPLVALLGIVAAQHRGQHIAADLIFKLFPAVARPWTLAALSVLSAVVTAAITWYGGIEALDAAGRGETAGVSSVPAWPVHFLVPLVFGVLTVQLLLAAFRAVTEGEPEQETEEAALLAELELADVNRTAQERS